jgi:allantoate deiminase
VLPGASNVIPGQVTLTLDVRHEKDSTRIDATNHLKRAASKVSCSWKIVGETPTVYCSARHIACLRKAALRHQSKVLNLVSGAGHDAAMMANICPVVMLFVRCRDGLSHHPDESVKPSDIGVALAVLSDYVNEFV